MGSQVQTRPYLSSRCAFGVVYGESVNCIKSLCVSLETRSPLFVSVIGQNTQNRSPSALTSQESDVQFSSTKSSSTKLGVLLDVSKVRKLEVCTDRQGKTAKAVVSAVGTHWLVRRGRLRAGDRAGEGSLSSRGLPLLGKSGAW